MARSAPPDYYELLGVPRDADSDAIGRAYRKLAKVSHPDSGGNAGIFRLLRVAYETLIDEEQRKQYDADLVNSDIEAEPDSEQPSQPDVVYPSGPAFDDGQDTAAPAAGLLVDPERLSWWASARTEGPVQIEPAYARGRWPAIAAVAAVVVLGICMAFIHSFAIVALVAGVVVLTGVYLGTSKGADVNTLIGAAAVVALTGVGVYMYTAASAPAVLLGVCYLLLLVSAAVLTRRFGLIALIDRLAPPDAIEQYEYGHPGESQRALTPGSDGEIADRFGADALLPLAMIPGVRVFHGLADPDGGPPVSHAVVCGRRVALLSSKYWPAGAYSWTPHGALMRDGAPVASGDLNLDTTVAVYRQSLAGRVDELRGFVQVIPSDGGRVAGSTSPTGLMLGDPQTIIDQIGGWFLSAGTPDVIDRRLLIRLYDHRVVIGGSGE